MLTATGVLVVAPFDCAWLTGEEFQLTPGRGFLLWFEVKGPTDATVILKPQSGSRRWQHLSTQAGVAGGRGGAGAAAAEHAGQARSTSPVESNYTVILGSHCNSCLKIEKDGELCCSVANVPGAKLSSQSFASYWINYNGGRIAVGTGQPGEQLCYCWTDPDPIENIRSVGLSAWDEHVGYRNIQMHAALQSLPASPASKQQRAVVQEQPAACDPGGVPGSLLDICCSTLRQELSMESVCAVLEVADCLAPVVDELRRHAIVYLARHFGAVAAQEPDMFSHLSVGTLVEVLCSQTLDCPEKLVFDAVMCWAGYGVDVASANSACRPMQDVEELLPFIRFPVMRDDELQAVGEHAMCGRSQLLRELVQEARESREEDGSGGRSPKARRVHQGPLSMQDKRHVRVLTGSERVASSRFQCRHAPGCTELIFMFGGDKNGVCWHLGTNYGTQAWVNPVLSGRVGVRASSPACRNTDPKALVSGNFLHSNFAGPRLEEGQLSSWWELDLGPSHQLICNHYTLRHDGSTDFLRSWVLQGSNDGSRWTDLRRHINDRTINMPGQYAAWPVGGHAAAVPYRRFRLLLVGPNPEASNPRHLCLSYLDLHGYLYKAGQQG